MHFLGPIIKLVVKSIKSLLCLCLPSHGPQIDRSVRCHNASNPFPLPLLRLTSGSLPQPCGAVETDSPDYISISISPLCASSSLIFPVLSLYFIMRSSDFRARLHIQVEVALRNRDARFAYPCRNESCRDSPGYPLPTKEDDISTHSHVTYNVTRHSLRGSGVAIHGSPDSRGSSHQKSLCQTVN
jgi:hypothetical protein